VEATTETRTLADTGGLVVIGGFALISDASPAMIGAVS